MTVKDLREILNQLSPDYDDAIVEFEYDGPDSFTTIEVGGFTASKNTFLLVEKVGDYD